MFHYLDWVCRKQQLLFVILLCLWHNPTAIMAVVVQSQCACGNVRMEIPAAAGEEETTVVDCHCPKCRKYHVSGFVRYMVVPHVSIRSTHGQTKTYRDKCDQVGAVDRIQCRQCASKLATRPVDGGDKMLVNMGPLVDSSLPPNLAKRPPEQWQSTSKATWVNAVPTSTTDEDALHQTRRRITGGCACGSSRYEMDCEQPTELQHCYCRLCRQFSGGPFMTWMPVWKDDFRWISSPPPPLVRTTPHGQRHFCADCGAALTIVYDDQPDMIWPAAGGLDDESFLNDLILSRVIHICCRYRPSWYSIPPDGLPRIPEAG